MDEENEIPTTTQSVRTRFAMSYGEAKPISDEKLASSRVKRSLYQQRKQQLVNGPTDGADLPIPHSVVERYRSPRAFMDEALKYLDPANVGKSFAALFMAALEKQDIHMLKLLLPYVFGQPAKPEEDKGQSGALFGEILSVLREPPIPKPRKQKQQIVEVPPAAEPFFLPEETEDDE